MPVLQIISQASWACSGTWDCTKSVERSGSIPPAMYWAAVRRTRCRSSSGGWGTVIACMSGMKKNAS